MEVEKHFYALITLLCIAGLVWAFYGPWQTYCVDRARYELFAIRDRLFRLGQTGTISFQSHEYRAMRSTIEKLIRYANETDLWQVIIYFYVLGAKYEPSASNDILRLLEGIQDPDLKAELLEIRRDMFRVMATLVRNRSLLVSTGLAVLKISNSLLRAHKRLQPFLTLVFDAIVYRADHEEDTRVRRPSHFAAS